MDKNLVIIKPDGGICSQISFVALGLAFVKKGFRVKYDLSWFKNHGSGFYGTHNGYDKAYDINFDVEKIFDLKLEIATQDEVNFYSKHYFIDRDNVIDFRPPLYIGGYKGRYFHFIYKDFFSKHFYPKELSQDSIDGKNLRAMLKKIDKNACGIHIRRGDLAKKHIVYGNAVEISYFLEAMKLARFLNPNVKFFVFSDDLDFIRRDFLPQAYDFKIEICDFFNPTKGYLDLYLLSRMQIIIASQGSLGIFAKLLSPHNATLIAYRHRYFEHSKILENIYFIAKNAQADAIIGGGRVQDSQFQTIKQQQHKKLRLINKIRLKIYYYLAKKLQQKGIIL